MRMLSHRPGLACLEGSAGRGARGTVRHPRVGWVVLCCSAMGLLAPSARGQEGQARSGVRARIVVAEDLRNAKNWPVRDERAEELRDVYRVRRPVGRGEPAPLSEPVPALTVVLEGAKSKRVPERRVVVSGLRFEPSELVLAEPGLLTVENREETFVTIDRVRGGELAILKPGETRTVKLPAGEHRITLRAFPFARAKVRVLQPSAFLEWDEDGVVPLVPVKPGEYQLSFYLGARALGGRPVTVPEDGVVAIDATVSANEVVTVSLKDGGLQVALPRRR